MKFKIVLMAIIIFILSTGGIAMASGSQNGKSDNSMAGMDMSGSNSSNDMKGMDMSGSNGSMKGMDMSGSNSKADSTSSDMPGMDMGGDKPIKETPPSVKVLGTFGAVNLAFIIIGVWNKWFRRKDGANVNA